MEVRLFKAGGHMVTSLFNLFEGKGDIDPHDLALQTQAEQDTLLRDKVLSEAVRNKTIQDSSARRHVLQMGRGGAAAPSTSATRVELAKKLIENYYEGVQAERKEANRRICGPLTEEARKNIVKEEVQAMRTRRRVLTIHDFRQLAVLGRGSFGEVVLVEKVDQDDSDSSDGPRKLYALKKIPKSETLKGDRLGRVMAERKMLVSADNDWFCKLHYAFHDEDYFYLVMEFLPGGDLLGMLIREDILTEDVSRFYIAELIIAVDYMHRMGFIHRDVKPDNILFDKSGHLKLSDFGLCKALVDVSDPRDTRRSTPYDDDEQPSFSQSKRMSSMQRRAAWKEVARKKNFTSVGTPNYVSYEVLMDSSYGEETDWWSVGAVIYEMLVGYPPFHAATAEETCRKIANYKRHLRFPQSRPISPEAEDLIRRLLCPLEIRLGSRDGLEEFKDHPFFHGVDWANIRKHRAVFVPDLASEIDLKYFDNGCLLPAAASLHDSYVSSVTSEESSSSSGSDEQPELTRKNTRTSLRKIGQRVLLEDLQLVGFALTKSNDDSHGSTVIPHPWS